MGIKARGDALLKHNLNIKATLMDLCLMFLVFTLVCLNMNGFNHWYRDREEYGIQFSFNPFE